MRHLMFLKASFLFFFVFVRLFVFFSFKTQINENGKKVRKKLIQQLVLNGLWMLDMDV
jgi:hypothetical protein